jgi:hypothetical protein
MQATYFKQQYYIVNIGRFILVFLASGTGYDTILSNSLTVISLQIEEYRKGNNYCVESVNTILCDLIPILNVHSFE